MAVEIAFKFHFLSLAIFYSNLLSDITTSIQGAYLDLFNAASHFDSVFSVHFGGNS